jgi:hypothetical protein
MTDRRKTRQMRRAKARKGNGIGSAIAFGGLVVVAALAVAILAASSDEDAADRTQAVVRTNEVNEMGMPVVLTPGTAEGTASAGGVQVSGAAWRMGTVPLLVAVRPTWTLVNSSDIAVSLGRPHPEVRSGCCPGPLTLGSRELAPHESTTLTFELAMHPGMDGWHDIAVHVPVSNAHGEDLLTLVVTGDFRGTAEF